MRLLAIAALLLTFAAPPVIAADSSASIPLQCSFASTKAAHPDWYRDGGYCTNHFQQTDHYRCAGYWDPVTGDRICT